MRRALISVFAVAVLVCANFLGMIMIANDLNSNDLSDTESHKDSLVPDLPIDKDAQDPDSLNQDEIDWSLLPQDKNPSARLFLEESALAIEYRLSEFEFIDTDSGEIIYIEGASPLMEPGSPMVPEIKFFAAVPEGAEVIGIEVEGEAKQVQGYHYIAPYLPKTLDGEDVGVKPNMDVYENPEPFPSNLMEYYGPDKLRHLEALEVALYPVIYRPAAGLVEVYDVLRIRVDLELANHNLPTISEDDALDIAVLDLIVNPQDVGYSQESVTEIQRGTRAPSTVYHTLGYHGDVGSIHPAKDTTMGNSGVVLLHEDDNTYYDAEAGKTLYVDGFDIDSANSLATLEYAMLHVQYKGPNGYNGNSYVKWAVEGQALSDTNIQPSDLNNSESSDLTYDLLGHAESPTTVSDIADLDIEFSEDGILSGSKDIPFDYIWIEFAYREELTGDSDYLIITDFTYADELRPLAEWKTNRLNIDTQVYDTDWISANCDGSNLMHKIKDFVRSMFENYSVEYVLLGGDENTVPTNTSSTFYDSFYANVVGFLYPDLATGRLATDSEVEMEGMVNDIFVHQRDMGSWKKDVLLLGTNIFSTGDGKRDMEYAKDNYLMNLDHTFYEDYEVEGNLSRSRTLDAYNQGMGLSIITGHGSRYGWYKHNGTRNFFNKNDVQNSMTNEFKRGFVWSSTCSSGGFVGSYICIGEMWVRARGGGGIGYIGAGQIAYYSSTMWLYRRFFDAYSDMMEAGEDPTQGVAHMKALNQINYKIYNLFGDPQVGLGLSSPSVDVKLGSFDSGSFETQNGFDQSETAAFSVNIDFPKTVLPKGVHFNFSVTNENGDTFYIDEEYIDDPADVHESFFTNWSIPSWVASGIYNFSVKIYNTSQDFEFTYDNNSYFFVDYDVKINSLEQMGGIVVEQDTVTYRVHIDNLIEAIPNAKVWVDLKGRDYDPYMTPFDHFASTVVTIPFGLDEVVDILITIPEPGTYDVSCGIDYKWAEMASYSGDITKVQGVRILDVSYNYPIYFREDTINVSYKYFAFSDFSASSSLVSQDQTNQLIPSFNFLNGISWLNFTWTIPKYHPNGTYDIELEILGLGRDLEIRTDSMRVVTVREILDLGENWLNSKQETNGGWNQSDWGWPPGTDYNETARAMQALLWSGVDQGDPVISDAADYIENNIFLDVVKRVDKLAEVVWAMVEAGRGSSPAVSDAAQTIRKMQNWVYEPEPWSVYFEGALNKTWLANISAYDEVGNLMYSYEYSGIFATDWQGVWVNFSVLPGTVNLNITLKTNYTFFMRQFVYPPLYEKDPTAWDSIWINDYDGYGDGVLWNRTCSEEFIFDGGWGERKGVGSIAGFTAWAVIGLYQAGAPGLYETDALNTGVQWLLDNQSADGSWFPYYFDGAMGMGGGSYYPGGIVGNWAEDYIQNTAISVIALDMNGTTGLPLDNGASYLKTRQNIDGSYPWLTGVWYYEINVVSTSHTLRALRRTGHVFQMDENYVKEAVRWLCAAQDQTTGAWDIPQNYTRINSEAMLALASLKFQRIVDLEPGWNLISLNLEIEDTSLVSVMGSIAGEYDAVQVYIATDPKDPWKHYHIAKPMALNDLSELDHTMGIWVHITNPAGAKFIYYGMEPKRNPQVMLYTGWNLVGYPSLSNRDKAVALNNIDFGVDIDLMQFNDPLSGWDNVGAGEKIVPGRGYWVHSKVDRVWEVPL